MEELNLKIHRALNINLIHRSRKKLYINFIVKIKLFQFRELGLNISWFSSLCSKILQELLVV